MLALITGASSGIGRATAVKLANYGYRLLLHGRRLERLLALQEELSSTTQVQILQADVQDKQMLWEALEALPENWKEIDVLINNAGNAHGLAPIHEGTTEDWDAMIDSNLKGLLYVSKAILPGMVKRRKGTVVNVGSIAGKEVYANGNVYCATKHAVDALTRSMRIDLNPYGIRVGCIHPGLVQTEFSLVRFKGDKTRADSVYQGYTPLTAEDVADCIIYMILAPPHVQIAEMVLLPTDQASATVVKKTN
jgi:NADP-dependent 3-hydroxy acid dehydrogenase YdfG